MATIKAIVFDLDGTLFDTFELIMSAYRHVAKTHNLREPTSHEIRMQMGKPLPDIFKTLYPDFSLEQLLETNNAFVAANAMTSQAFSGVHDILDILAAKNLTLAIVTSGSGKVFDILRHHDLEKYFTSVVHHERVQNFKPDPEGYLLACKESNVLPEHTIMVGDTVVDVQTGQNAHAFATIAVTHGYAEREDLENAKPTYIVDSLEEVKDTIVKLL